MSYMQTDVSAVGLGAVLEQDNTSIGYTIRAFSKSEYDYSTIQKKCLAIVFAMKQLYHYLLRHLLTLISDD